MYEASSFCLGGWGPNTISSSKTPEELEREGSVLLLVLEGDFRRFVARRGG